MSIILWSSYGMCCHRPTVSANIIWVLPTSKAPATRAPTMNLRRACSQADVSVPVSGFRSSIALQIDDMKVR